MRYENVMERIKELENFGSKPGLERITKLLNLIDNPQNKLKCIHVAGTNGKGSVCFALDAILREGGYKTGRYISPSISDFSERISINGENIDRKSIIKLFDFFTPCLERDEFKDDPVTEFELTTAMAFKFFADNNCDIVIIETGMGGKFDATNVISQPVCSVITSISLDHTNVLGDDISKIAIEKLGIVKRGCPVVISDDQPCEIYELAKNICKNFNSEQVIADKTELKNPKSDYLRGISFKYKGVEITTNALGNHQIINLSCALKVIETIGDIFPVELESIKRAMHKLIIPCRLECVHRNPVIILDAAHNPHGTAVLADFLQKNFIDKKIYGIVGMFKDKDYETSLKNVLHILDAVYTISPNVKRAESLEKITDCAKKYCKHVVACKNIKYAMEQLMRVVKSDDIVVVFGSFSVIREFKNLNFGT